MLKRKPRRLLPVAMVVLLLAPAARAYESPSRLNEVARVYSLGVGEVRCPSRAEWDAYPADGALLVVGREGVQAAALDAARNLTQPRGQRSSHQFSAFHVWSMNLGR
jgi:hypothetical protein